MGDISNYVREAYGGLDLMVTQWTYGYSMNTEYITGVWAEVAVLS